MRLQFAIPFTVLSTLLTHALVAQDTSGRRTVGSPPPPPRGIFQSIYDYAPGPRSLSELVKRADVIVDGTVQSVFPTRLRDANDPSSIERDSLFAVNRVLKGTPEALRSLVITQMGGKYGDVVIAVKAQWPLMPGDRHILFLNYDRRTIVPTYPRTDANFSIINGAMGNFKIEGNAVKWMSDVQLDDLKKFQSGTAEDFITQIMAEVSAAH